MKSISRLRKQKTEESHNKKSAEATTESLVKKRKFQSPVVDEETTQVEISKPKLIHENTDKEFDISNQQSNFTNRTVYIEGIPFTATETDIQNFFKDTGKIISIRLPKWHDSGRLRGYGHVEFENDQSAEKALEMDGKFL